MFKILLLLVKSERGRKGRENFDGDERTGNDDDLIQESKEINKKQWYELW